jgi:DNA-directed RNA polymerase subunit E'/Rpb7
MEPYFEERVFVEIVVVHPKYLGPDLFEHLRLLITRKYPKTYKNIGYIFNIKPESVLENKISLSGQIVLTVKFKTDLYVPKVDHTFYNLEIMKAEMSKYRWVEIGPLTVFLKLDGVINDESQPIDVQLTNVKADYTINFGKILS